jgi:hypothetical protein
MYIPMPLLYALIDLLLQILFLIQKYVSGPSLLLDGPVLLFLVCGINILILFSGTRLKSSKQRELKFWQCWAEPQEGPMKI